MTRVKSASSILKTLALALLAAVVLFQPCPADGQRPIPMPVAYQNATPSGLPLPSSLPLADYEDRLYGFLFERTYTGLNWAVDRKVRDTGDRQEWTSSAPYRLAATGEVDGQPDAQRVG